MQNPIAGLRKPKAPEGRERRLKPGELQALTKACSTVTGSWLLHGFQLAIETGLRRGELLGIRWQHVRLDTAVLHVPFTKTDKARTIPLTDRAKAILTERRAECSTDADDVAPKFYPDLSSFGRLDVPIRAVVAAGAGAELSA